MKASLPTAEFLDASCALCKRFLDGTTPVDGAIRLLNDADLSEPYLRWLQMHRIGPLSDSVLSRAGARGLIPTSHPSLFVNVARVSLLADQLVWALGQLEAVGVPAIPFKGPTQAEYLYGTLGLRIHRDLDVIVPKDKVQLAVQALSERYEAMGELDLDAVHEREIALRHRTHDVVLEIQWGLVLPWQGYELDSDGYFAHPASRSFHDCGILCISDPALLVHLAVHAAQHSFESLDWSLDIALLARKLSDEDWVTAAQHAEKVGAARVVYVALGLVKRFFGLDFLAKWPSEFRVPQRVIRRLVGLQAPRFYAIYGDAKQLRLFKLRDTLEVQRLVVACVQERGFGKVVLQGRRWLDFLRLRPSELMGRPK